MGILIVNYLFQIRTKGTENEQRECLKEVTGILYVGITRGMYEANV